MKNLLVWNVVLLFSQIFLISEAEIQQIPGWTYWPDHFFGPPGDSADVFEIGTLTNNEGRNGRSTSKRSIGPGYDKWVDDIGKQHEIFIQTVTKGSHNNLPKNCCGHSNTNQEGKGSQNIGGTVGQEKLKFEVVDSKLNKGGTQSSSHISAHGSTSQSKNPGFNSQSSVPKDGAKYSGATTQVGKGSIVELRSGSTISRILLPPPSQNVSNHNFHTNPTGSNSLSSQAQAGDINSAQKGNSNSVSGVYPGNNNANPTVLKSSNFLLQGSSSFEVPVLNNGNGLPQVGAGLREISQSNIKNGVPITQNDLQINVPLYQSFTNNEVQHYHGGKNKMQVDLEDLVNDVVKCLSTAQGCDELIRNATARRDGVDRRQKGETGDLYGLETPWKNGAGITASQEADAQEFLRIAQNIQSNGDNFQSANELRDIGEGILGGVSGKLMNSRGLDEDRFTEGVHRNGRGNREAKNYEGPIHTGDSNGLRTAGYAQTSTASVGRSNENSAYPTNIKITKALLLNEGGYQSSRLNELASKIGGISGYNQGYRSSSDGIGYSNGGLGEGYSSTDDNSNRFSSDIAAASNGEGWPSLDSYPDSFSNGVGGSSDGWPKSPGGSSGGWPKSPGGSSDGWPKSSGGSIERWPKSPGGSSDGWPKSPGGSSDGWPKSPVGSSDGWTKSPGGSSYGWLKSQDGSTDGWSKSPDGSDPYSSGYSGGGFNEGWPSSDDGWDESEFNTIPAGGEGWPGDSEGWKTVNYEVQEGPGWEDSRKPKPPPHILKLKSLGKAWVRLIRRIFLKEGRNNW